MSQQHMNLAEYMTLIRLGSPHCLISRWYSHVFLGTLIFLDKEIAKKHGIARHEAGLGRSEYQESGGKGWDVGGL
jgi:hypothetical protein